MAYINVPEGVPGIRSLVLFRPETGQPLYELAQVLLRGPSPLTAAERELIAAYVSSRNNCAFCRDSHAAAARSLYARDRSETGDSGDMSDGGGDSVGSGDMSDGGGDSDSGDDGLVDAVLQNPGQAELTGKMKALLNIAGKVQILGKEVTAADIAAAREQGADDREIHDTVLIAAAFSMFNRYVDGLASWTPTDPAVYKEMGQRLAEKGYVSPKPVNQI